MAKPTSHYPFIDGGCLRSTLEWKLSKYVPVDQCRFDVEEFAPRFSKVFLYDAVPAREPNEPEADYIARIKPQQDMLDAAARMDRVHVYEGTALRRNKRLEQKKVDVMIAVDMLTHTFRRNMDFATLLTGDGDFHPLVDALVHEGMFVNISFLVGRTSKDLLRPRTAAVPFSQTSYLTFWTRPSGKACRFPRSRQWRQ